jgi:uncharacterized protein YjiS (DUF1127 family)
MTIRYATDELALMMATSMSSYFTPSDRGFNSEYSAYYYNTPAPARSGIMARIGAWLKRRAAMSELAALTDHELADIGLSRGDLAFAFEQGFVTKRNEDRFGTKLQTSRIQHA